MSWTRREWGAACLTGAVASAASPQWSPEWDRALIDAALAAQDRSFDPVENLLRRSIGPDYNYHSALRNTVGHPTRDSAEYALLLLETGDPERVRRARAVIERILALQVTDPESRWYGIWGYYAEEPPHKMSPADWNWADFNGSMLLLIEARHRDRFNGPQLQAIREGIRHAAASVRRRNVTMTYTNIAVQGTFVTLCAAELLKDADLLRYALDRLRRFSDTVNETGSFAEYNSPTYAQVTIANFTRLRMLARDREALPLIDKLHHRAWLHLASHWHAPTKQLAGPMSRAYSTDIRQPVWLQKSLGGKLAWLTLDQVRAGEARSGEVGILDYQCPDALVPMFLELKQPRQHREVFLPAAAPVRPVQGTTWLDREYTLGSINRADFWIQRRPLLVYWKGGYLQPRFIKDDYDFSSALYYGVQERGRALFAVNFRSPGGDKHISLDPIPDGRIKASRLRLRFDVAGDVRLPAKVSLDEPVSFEAGGVRVTVQVRAAAFGGFQPKLVAESGGFSLVLVDEPQPVEIQLKELARAFAVVTVAVGREASAAFALKEEPGVVRATWGGLGLSASTRVATAAEQDRVFEETVGGKPTPLVRLSDERI